MCRLPAQNVSMHDAWWKVAIASSIFPAAAHRSPTLVSTITSMLHVFPGHAPPVRLILPTGSLSPFSPLMAATAGRLSEGADGDRMNISFWFKPVTPGDSSIVFVQAADPAATGASSYRMFITAEPSGVAITMSVFGFGVTDSVALAVGLDATEWHSVHLLGAFTDLFDDKWTVLVDGVDVGTYDGFFAIQRDYLNPSAPYLLSARVKFHTSVPVFDPSLESDGFLFDDFEVSVWRSADFIVLDTYGKAPQGCTVPSDVDPRPAVLCEGP